MVFSSSLALSLKPNNKTLIFLFLEAGSNLIGLFIGAALLEDIFEIALIDDNYSQINNKQYAFRN